jgi:hypothetical protein
LRGRPMLLLLTPQEQHATMLRIMHVICGTLH